MSGRVDKDMLEIDLMSGLRQYLERKECLAGI